MRRAFDLILAIAACLVMLAACTEVGHIWLWDAGITQFIFGEPR